MPGCWSQGVTEEEALENIKDAIETYTMGGIIKDAGMTVEKFKKLL